jgi:hypothetical protein
MQVATERDAGSSRAGEVPATRFSVEKRRPEVRVGGRCVEVGPRRMDLGGTDGLDGVESVLVRKPWDRWRLLKHLGPGVEVARPRDVRLEGAEIDMRGHRGSPTRSVRRSRESPIGCRQRTRPDPGHSSQHPSSFDQEEPPCLATFERGAEWSVTWFNGVPFRATPRSTRMERGTTKGRLESRICGPREAARTLGHLIPMSGVLDLRSHVAMT